MSDTTPRNSTHLFKDGLGGTVGRLWVTQYVANSLVCQRFFSQRHDLVCWAPLRDRNDVGRRRW